MKTIILCGGSKCCPKLIVTRDEELRFIIVDDYEGRVALTDDEARNLALAIFKEIGASA